MRTSTKFTTPLLTALLACTVFFFAWTPANATPILIDFSGVPDGTDITYPNSITLNGVTFTYEDQGNNSFALADQLGIYGQPNNGLLILSFASPVYGVSFNYQDITFGNPGPVGDAIVGIFTNAGQDAGVVIESGMFNELKLFSHSGAAFDQAAFYFAYEADLFTADTFAFEPTHSPEPASLALLGIGLLGFGFLRRRRPA